MLQFCNRPVRLRAGLFDLKGDWATPVGHYRGKGSEIVHLFRRTVHICNESVCYTDFVNEPQRLGKA